MFLLIKLFFISIFLFLFHPLFARTVSVGIYNNPPKVSWEKSKKPEGIFVDILIDIAEKENWQLKYVFCTWQNCLEMLENGEIDLMLDVAYSKSRNKQFDFNRLPVLSSWLQLHSNKDSNIQNIRDMNGKKIAILEGSIQQNILMKKKKDWNLSYKLIKKPDYNSSIQAVESGEADAVIVGRFYSYNKNKSHFLKPASIILSPSTLHFATKKNRNLDLLSAIDSNLTKILNNGNSIYYKSLVYWLHEKPPTLIPAYLIWTLTGIALSSAFLVIVSLVFKKQVQVRTKELSNKNIELQKIISEKDALHRELFHRTKNNMQVIISILMIQELFSKSDEDIKRLKDSIDKIKVMALAQQKLFQSKDLSYISLKEYISDHINLICNSMNVDRTQIHIRSRIAPVRVLIDIANPLGLLLHELLSNSIKYAFPDGEGLISIRVKESGDILFLKFQDNGIGLPEDYNFDNTEAYGMQSIIGIVKNQLQGKIKFKQRKGFTCSICFSKTVYKNRI
ncbi:MAG: transporter substrate-binding domain-containing protein [Leptospiraceae bacterium]|nr:transporter substrate-binding domain-containing protein [Leptospiraceae bacterium]